MIVPEGTLNGAELRMPFPEKWISTFGRYRRHRSSSASRTNFRPLIPGAFFAALIRLACDEPEPRAVQTSLPTFASWASVAVFAPLFAARAALIDVTNLVSLALSAGAGGGAGELETFVDAGSDETAAAGLLLGDPTTAPTIPKTTNTPTTARTAVQTLCRAGQLFRGGGGGGGCHPGGG